MVKLSKQQEEALRILQEESAEVIQAVSKIFRFGLEGKHPEKKETNQEHLEIELGDLEAMIDILVEQGLVDLVAIKQAKIQKKEKLRQWSKLIIAENQ